MDELAQAHSMSMRADNAPDLSGNTFANSKGALYKINGAVAEYAGQVEPDAVAAEGEPTLSNEQLRARIAEMMAPSTDNTLVQQARSMTPDTSDQITEDALILDKNFIAASRDIYEMFEGKQFTGTADEAVQYGLDTMGEFSFNFFGVPGVQLAETESGFAGGGTLAQAATIIASGDPGQAQSFLYAMGQYERLPNFTKAGMARVFRGLVNDPANVMGIASGGLPFVLKQIGQDTAAMGVRKALQSLAKNPVKYSAAAGGAYSSGFEAATMDIERASGRDISAGEELARFGLSTGIGTVAGATIGKMAEKVLPVVGDAIVSASDAAKGRMATPGTQLNSGVDIDPAIAMAGDIVNELRATDDAVPQSHPGRISTRQPSEAAVSKGQSLDPIENNLIIGLDESKASGEKAFNHNVDTFRSSPNMTEAEAKLPPDEAAEAFIEHVKKNLLWLHDKVPEKTRQRSKLWYDGARAVTDRWSDEYNVADGSIAGILAALSPQKDWYQNVSLGKRVLDIMTQKTNVPFDEKMLAKAIEVFPGKAGIINLMKGKSIDELDTTAEKALWLRFYDEVYNSKEFQILTPEGNFGAVVKNDDGSSADMAWGTMNSIEKAVNSFYSNGDRATLSKLMGERHKVRNFYNNILDPNGIYGDVTIDTHAVGAGVLRPVSASSYDVYRAFGTAPTKKDRIRLDPKEGQEWVPSKSSAVTGQKGTYGFFAEAYRRAAAERDILPREMQSITWEAVRGLFSPTFKSDENNVKMIRGIWEEYKKGNKSIDEVRDEIEKAANYITPPTWQ